MRLKKEGEAYYISYLFQEEEEEEEAKKKEREKEWLLGLKEVEKMLNYEFNNKIILRQAFTHSSFLNGGEKESYERLEFMGDSALNLVICTEMFMLYPDLLPGDLTKLKAANVDNEKLARVSIKYGFHGFLRHKVPELQNSIREFENEISNYPVHSNGLVDTPKILADVVESVIGAVYIDSNASVVTVWKVFKEFLEPIITPETLKVHPMTELYELCQKNKLKIDFLQVSKNEKCPTYYVVLDNKVIGEATYPCKKEVVKNQAAKAALDHLKAIMNV